jgi:hypothetical protein
MGAAPMGAAQTEPVRVKPTRMGPHRPDCRPFGQRGLSAAGLAPVEAVPVGMSTCFDEHRQIDAGGLIRRLKIPALVIYAVLAWGRRRRSRLSTPGRCM